MNEFYDDELQTLESNLIDASDDYEYASDETGDVIENLKKVRQIRLDALRYEDEKLEKERQMNLNEVREKSNARLEELRIEAEEKKSKRQTALGVVSSIASLALGIIFVFADETRNAIRDGKDACKSLIKR